MTTLTVVPVTSSVTVKVTVSSSPTLMSLGVTVTVEAFLETVKVSLASEGLYCLLPAKETVTL